MNKGKNHQTNKMTLEDLSELKMQIRHRIDLQEELVKYSAKNLIPASPVKLFSSFTSAVSLAMGLSSGSKKTNKGISVVNGLIIGYKVARGVGKILRKRKI